MNKKTYGIIIAVIIVIASIVGMKVLGKKGIKPMQGIGAILKPSVNLDSPAKLLPEKTVILYSLTDLQSIWKDISKSNFWNEFSKLRVWTDFGILSNIKKLIAAMEQKIGIEITESRILDLFGSRINIAVSVDEVSKEVHVFVQSHVGKKTQFLEGMLKSLPEASDIGVTQTTYNSETINFLKVEGEESVEIRYTLVNNILTFAFGKADKELKTIIDLIKENGGNSLYQEPLYLNSIKTLMDDEDCTSLYYADFTKISGMLTDLIKPLMESQPEQFAGIDMDTISDNLSQIKVIKGKMLRTKDGVTMLTQISPNFEKMSAEQKDKWNQKSVEIKSLSFAPKDSLIVNVSTALNLGQMWDSFMEGSKTESETETSPIANLSGSIQDFEKQLNINIKKDLIDLAGGELEFIFNGISLDGIFPIPRLGLVISSKDSKTLVKNITSIIEKLTSGEDQTLPLTISKKDVEGKEFTMLETPLGEGLSPLIGTHDSWVIIASNGLVAKTLIDAYKGNQENILKNVSFQKVLSQNKNLSQCSFADLKGLNVMITGLIGWILERKDMIPQAAQFQDITTNISTYAIPFLNSLKVLNSVSFSSYTEDDNSVQKVNLNINDL